MKVCIEQCPLCGEAHDLNYDHTVPPNTTVLGYCPVNRGIFEFVLPATNEDFERLFKEVDAAKEQTIPNYKKPELSGFTYEDLLRAF